MIVLDASAVVELLFRTARGLEVAALVEDATLSLHAPALLDLEVTQVVRKYLQREVVSLPRARAAIDVLTQLDIERYLHAPLLERVWELRDNLTAYDAAYVALAELLPAKLVTTDAKMAASASRWVEVELPRAT